ncbi:MAG: DEAD/DEAH box helicase [Hyphomonadaceae bacterium]
MTQFTDLALNPRLLETLAAKGYVEPTPIQAQAIPGVMAGRDLLGIAQTGTGKTAAFALPILHRLAENRQAAPRRGARALILSPTRELASQIAEQFRAYGAELGFSVATIFGGVSFGPQQRNLDRGVDILVATPGRLLDHISERTADLRGLEIFVLDEADQMLDMGFIHPIRQIVKRLPQSRQNLFFSATMPTDIRTLADELLTDPLSVTVTPPSTTVERINQQVVHVERARKRALLIDLFNQNDFSRVLVFTRTKRGADRVARILEDADVAASAIHGNKSQAQRERALAAFRTGDVRALVATDIAARGIDISSVSHVVQFDLPEVPETYVHRIGRTARAGADGSAVAFCCEDDRGLLRDIERNTRQKIPSIDRRGDTALAAIAAASPEPQAEARGEPQPRRQQQQRRRPERNARPERQRPERQHAERPRAEGQAEGHTAEDVRAEGRNAERKPRPQRERRPEERRGEERRGDERRADGHRADGRRSNERGEARSEQGAETRRERRPERSGERTNERPHERKYERSGERSRERFGDRNRDRSGERAGEGAGERSKDRFPRAARGAPNGAKDRGPRRNHGERNGDRAESRFGDTRNGQGRNGQGRNGPDRNGQSRNGQGRFGEARTGEARNGEGRERRNGDHRTGGQRTGGPRNGEHRNGEGRNGERREHRAGDDRRNHSGDRPVRRSNGPNADARTDARPDRKGPPGASASSGKPVRARTGKPGERPHGKKPHRKGQGGKPRSDVFGAKRDGGPVTPAGDLMRKIGSRNPWSEN